VSHFIPVKWGILALEGAIWRGFDLADMLPPCGILLSIGVLSSAWERGS
jgi:ABC-2 type transport system permease protein